MTRRFIGTTGLIAVVTGVLCAGPAAADDTAPPPAPLPAEAPPPTQQTIVPPDFLSSLGNILAQNGSNKAGPLGLPDISSHGTDLLLAQNQAPAAPGAGALAGIYPMNAWESNYLLPQTEKPSMPGQGTLAPGIGPTPEIPGSGRISFLRRLHAMYAAGELKGAGLGQMSPEEFEASLAEATEASDPANS